MKWIVLICVAIALVAAAVAIWVRVKPLPVAQYYMTQPMRPAGDYPMEGGFWAVRPGSQVELSALDGLILATPRTVHLAGSVAEGHISYVTRSAFWRFPDVTNLWLEQGKVNLRSHLVFGRGDLGVNRARIAQWLKAAGMVIPTP
ncbi:hypothetical protein BFP70_14395 [Thioclava sp. SK-1]|uniref:DUF1499 domain-containing protein n=1 Tax=Thioclava sp. SK-1 TaxID=1889770 RepID=UPI000824F5C7|nr:DUF1499 domain-containing protein [Thioclava sp. SK-1]OCX62074.1 hypothetical protein BFP70_14395 [Thioclava sp. SK-1]